MSYFKIRLAGARGSKDLPKYQLARLFLFFDITVYKRTSKLKVHRYSKVDVKSCHRANLLSTAQTFASEMRSSEFGLQKNLVLPKFTLKSIHKVGNIVGKLLRGFSRNAITN